MADIDVVPSKKTNTWVWIIVAIVLAVIVLAVMGVFSARTPNRIGQSLRSAPGTVSMSVLPNVV